MIEAIKSNAFDLEKVINMTFLETDTEKRRQADYILTTFAKEYNLDVNELRNAIIKVVETFNIESKKIKEKKKTSKRVIKYYVMNDKDKLNIIKELTVQTKDGMKKNLTRNIQILEREDLVKLGYITEENKINYDNPLVKKLGLKLGTDYSL